MSVRPRPDSSTHGVFEEDVTCSRRTYCGHLAYTSLVDLCIWTVGHNFIDKFHPGLNVSELRQVCEEKKDQLAALMITYPSTHGVFEEDIVEICSTIHEFGGLIYMDGANMNAHLGLTAPGTIGADVCHLNLHKTFSIPHGGGGPGMGPICCNKKLAPFLPGHMIHSPGGRTEKPVQSAPYGQAGIASIPWMFISMLGETGLKQSAEVAILNANYMKARLEKDFCVRKANKNNRCSHEFIIDVVGIKKTSGVTEEDIAKRLQDYGRKISGKVSE